MLTPSKFSKLHAALKNYNKRYLHGRNTDLDESGTRLMINSFLTDVLEFEPIDEVKTEYMIRGTYADYVVQTKGVRHFLVEVKSLSLALSDKHLRQASNYGANEGIDWALLTNGKNFELYRILFNKPIEARKVFSLDLSDANQLKNCTELIQFLHRDSVNNKGLAQLWLKTCALDPHCVAGLLYSPTVVNHIKKLLKEKFKSKFTDDQVEASITRVIKESLKMENVKMQKQKSPKKAKEEKKELDTATVLTILQSNPDNISKEEVLLVAPPTES